MLNLRVLHLLLNTGHRIGIVPPYRSVFSQHHWADKLKERTTFPLIRVMPTTSQRPDNREKGNELAPFDSELWAVHRSPFHLRQKICRQYPPLWYSPSRISGGREPIWAEKTRVPPSSSRRQVYRELITFFLIALLLSQLSVPNWLAFQPHRC